jgi:ribonucleotide monophosphatase NagD (HAD superfamily)
MLPPAPAPRGRRRSRTLLAAGRTDTASLFIQLLVVGSETLADAVRAQELVVVCTADDRPDTVIQGFSPGLGWKDLAEAACVVAAGAVWVTTNTDMSLPQERGNAPGNGTLVAAVAAATAKSPSVAGKPGAALSETAARHSVVDRGILMGDRIDTDILGEIRAGMATGQTPM